MTNESEMPMGLLLIRDRAVQRSGLRRLLELHEIGIAGDTANVDAAYTLFRRLNPTMVLIEVATPSSKVIAMMRELLSLRRDARIIIFSMHEHPISAAQALRAGAFGYVTKASAPTALVEAIRSVAAGNKYLSAEIAQRVALHDHAISLRHELTERELEVLRLLALGFAISEIAESMKLSVKTIGNQQTSIKNKLQAETAVELLRKASAIGLVQLY